MDESETIEVELPSALVESVDKMCATRGYLDREELVRAAVRTQVHDADHPPVSDDLAELQRLLDRGLSPAQALDYLRVEIHGLSVSEWARERGTSPQAISETVIRAREALEKNGKSEPD